MSAQGSSISGPLQGDEIIKDRSLNGFKIIDDLALKQNMHNTNFGVIWRSMFESLNVQINELH